MTMALEWVDKQSTLRQDGDMAKTKPAVLSEQLREAIRKSGLSMLAVARGAELDKATMSRFLSGERGLRLDAVDKLCALLRLRLMAECTPRKRKQ